MYIMYDGLKKVLGIRIRVMLDLDLFFIRSYCIQEIGQHGAIFQPCSQNVIKVIASVAELHYFYAAPAPEKILMRLLLLPYCIARQNF
jgi:hypothetical protein